MYLYILHLDVFWPNVEYSSLTTTELENVTVSFSAIMRSLTNSELFLGLWALSAIKISIWLFWYTRHLLPWFFKTLAQPRPLLWLPWSLGLLLSYYLFGIQLFLWTNESRLSKPYLQLFFFPSSSFADVWGLWKSETEEKKNKYSECFLRMPGLLSFLCLCSRHKASVSISHRSFSPELFYSKVQRRIYSHLVNSNRVIQFLKEKFYCLIFCVGLS